MSGPIQVMSMSAKSRPTVAQWPSITSILWRSVSGVPVTLHWSA